MVRELHNENAVFGYQSDERDQSDLAVDVQRGESQERKHQRAGNRQWNRTRENDERIAETFELRGKNEINQDRRQKEGSQELAALHAKLAGLARVVDGGALR